MEENVYQQTNVASLRDESSLSEDDTGQAKENGAEKSDERKDEATISDHEDGKDEEMKEEDEDEDEGENWEEYKFSSTDEDESGPDCDNEKASHLENVTGKIFSKVKRLNKRKFGGTSSRSKEDVRDRIESKQPSSTPTSTISSPNHPSTSENRQSNEDLRMRTVEREDDNSSSSNPISESMGNNEQAKLHFTDSDSSLGFGDTSSNSQDDYGRDLSGYDPTPWDNPYPQTNWYSWRQFISREYGKNVKPGPLKKRPDYLPFNPYWFCRYAYNSLYFIQRMEMTEPLESHSGCVNCLNFNSTGNLLCSGSDDLRINIWDWQRNKVKHSYSSGHTSNVFQSRWCLDDTHIISCARDGQVRICDINNISGSSKRIAHHLAPTHRLTMTGPQVVLSCGEDASVYEIDLRTNIATLLLVLRSSKKRPIPLYSIHCNMMFTPNYFAVAGRSPMVSVFDRRFLRKPSFEEATSSRHSSSDDDSPGIDEAPNPTPVMQLCAKDLEKTNHSVTCAVYNSVGSKLLMSYNDEDMYVFDVKTGQQETKYQGHRNSSTIKGCSWFGDQFVLSGSDDGYIYGWDLESQHIVMSVQADDTGAVNCIEPHPNIPVLATSGLDDTIKVWVPTSDTWPKTLTGIKKRICENIRDRSSDNKRFSFNNAGGPIIWLVLRHIRDRIRNNRRDDDSESQDGEDNSMDGSCLPS